jgi:endonuclease/exonuclease/phosphatase family metal-dependent hydrolase
LLIAGDLNEGPTGDALLAAKGAGYQDTWALLHPDDEGPTYPASDPRSRIDYLLLSPPDESPGESVRALQVQRFLQDASGGRYPSDHLGVWAELGPVD